MDTIQVHAWFSKPIDIPYLPMYAKSFNNTLSLSQLNLISLNIVNVGLIIYDTYITFTSNHILCFVACLGSGVVLLFV